MKVAKKKGMLTASLFGWEDSYFGGFERVVYDHPNIHIPNNIRIEVNRMYSATWYVCEKVCKIFLLKVSKFCIGLNLVRDAQVEEIINPMTGAKSKVYCVSRHAKRNCIETIIDSDSEMKSLFQHYNDVIMDADFYIAVPEKDDKKQESPDSGGTRESSDHTMEELMSLANALSGIDVQKYIWQDEGKSSVSGKLKERTTFKVMPKRRKSCIFTPDQIRMANSLVSLLDISFEPKEDIIENLICGKMSPHKVAEIPAGNTHVYYKVEQDVSTRPFSVCVLGDESGSMRGYFDRMQNELFKVLYYAFAQILPPQKMFFYGHSGVTSPEIRVYHELYNPDFEHTIDHQLNNNYSENYDGPVIENVYERVRKQTSDNIIFISISDGAPAGRNYGGEPAIEELKRVIEKCKRDGFVTMGVGLRLGLVKKIYGYHTVVNNMADLVKNVSSLVNRVVKTEFKD